MPLFLSALATLINLQPHVYRMAKAPFLCPPGEPHLHHKLRLYPMRALDGRWQGRKRRRFRFERAQLLPDQTELRVGESGRHASDISELTLIVGDGEQQ